MNPVLQMQNISKQFKSGDQLVDALSSVNFSIQAGEFISVLGPSGSGKSTFLTLAGCLQHPSDGVIRFNGQSLGNLTVKQQTKFRFDQIGFVLQSSNLISFLSVLEHFQFIDKLAGRSFNRVKAQELLENLGVTQLTAYPNQLSGGQRQRVAIAKALYNNPQLILADEPTASLDTQRSFQVVDQLVAEAHQRNKAAIMVTHDERLISKSDQVYRIEDGKMQHVS
ncbi:ABC transporter ATP-binding protein [Paucilactobacillus hokkaidonensis JCM 18461]|uniref:ABC transporter ATP-binding protein n=2 Tax=Paucilactobacillus hokkaidonensis TaxID=1193095 RepID=A0A0A1H0D6_9LACO|nr:ABC transporter ATP-binding protein [Paucilactobacillus hokkaidonensis]KRO08940.1 abc transporter, atp-binding protein [Paucilactobacillus hokkaidonensis]BAP86146.1 ABC transporter ATP-binding protein [Paucilactobacillus hokkaidonensis JCM 18461]